MATISEIWRNKFKILEGIKNTILKKDHIEKIAQERMSLCESCDLIDRTGEKCMIPGTQPCCGECGCKLKFKTRSLSSSCPHPLQPKWEAVLTQTEEDKLYEETGFKAEE